jgi:hypothetical protein
MVNNNFLQKKKLCQEDIEDKDRPGKRSEIPLMFEWTSLLLRANSNTECAGTTLVPSFPSFPQTCFVADNGLSVERTKQYIYMMKTCLSEKMTIAKISTAGYAQQNHL